MCHVRHEGARDDAWSFIGVHQICASQKIHQAMQCNIVDENSLRKFLYEAFFDVPPYMAESEVK